MASAVNIAPISNAGAAQSVVTGAVVTLDGNDSSDANGDLLIYNWSLTSKPAGSSAALSSATNVNPKFTADVVGAYVLSLVVNDGKVSSASSTVNITTMNTLTPTKLPKTGQTTSYAAGDDGDLEVGVVWPNPRFTDNGDQSVTDNMTGLIWVKDANLIKTRDPSLYGYTTYDGAGIPTTVPGNTWQQALDYVKKLNSENYLSHNDWRLPNINELRSLVNFGQSNQSTWLNGQGFTNVLPRVYYSATISQMLSMSIGHFDGPQMVYFGNWGNSIPDDRSFWPVRSGQTGAFGTLTLPKTGQINCYKTTTDQISTTTNPISCIGTGQDGESQTGIAWPAPRFTDNSLSNITEKTVTDNLTGLVWSKDANLANGNKTWLQALDYVKTLNIINFSGHNDWRLPNNNELSSLVNFGQGYQSTWLNGQGFTNVNFLGGCWSATKIINFDAPQALCVWPVRSGQ